jgi:hypothetical protein
MRAETAAPSYEKRYESWELRPKPFILGLIGFALALAVIFGIVLLVHNGLFRAAGSQFVPRSVAEGKMEVSDSPPLQPQVGHDVSEAEDLMRLRAGETAVFDKLGWKWDESRQLHTIPPAVVEAVRHRPSATQPTAATSAARGAK